MHSRGELALEAGKCMYCGFCEPVCPTIDYGTRMHGPRGRLRVARLILEGARPTRLAEESLFTCILCAACVEACPARIDIVAVIRGARSLILEG
ncbi:MAG: (Fe-S)-binding protein [Desulfurococcales archaeon]|nr:(Fe-S)-binding protein [Desulfurococcales archaeon]